MAKTLVHKTNTSETMTITGVLDEQLIITGENGDRVDVAERLLEFVGVGQEVTIGIKTKDEDTLESIG